METLETREVPSAFTNGDVFVSVGSGKVKEFTPAGVLVQTLDTGTGAAFTTGSTFDAAGNFYVTDFGSNKVTKFNGNGVLQGDFGSKYATPEDIVHDAAGNFYVGGISTTQLQKFDPTGKLLATFTVAIHIDWLDLAADQHTIFYDPEGTQIKRFDTATNKQLADFNTTPLPASGFALRLLPGGGLLIADSNAVRRLDDSGKVVQTYTPKESVGLLFAMNLDRDGTTFWTADLTNGNVFRFNIQTGAELSHFNSAPFTDAAGLAVKGEITVGGGGGGNVSLQLSHTVFWPNRPNSRRPSTNALGWVILTNNGADITGDYTVSLSLPGVTMLPLGATRGVKAIGSKDGIPFITLSGGLKHGQSVAIYVRFTYLPAFSLDFMRKKLHLDFSLGDEV